MGNPMGEIYSQDGGESPLDSGAGGMQNGDQAQGTGFNPNFQPLLAEIPQDLHSKIIPHLNSWDGNYRKLQSDIEPWKELFSSGATPEMVRNGLAFLSMLERDPKQLYNILGESVNQGPEVPSPNITAPSSGQGQSIDDPYDLRFQQMEKNQIALAQHLLEMRQKESEARADAAIASEFAAAHKKLGNFDDNMVRNMCIANPELSIEQAATTYLNWYRAEMAKHGARPIIEGAATSGVPGRNIDVTKLSPQQTRAAAADMLRQMKRAANDY